MISGCKGTIRVPARLFTRWLASADLTKIAGIGPKMAMALAACAYAGVEEGAAASSASGTGCICRIS